LIPRNVEIVGLKCFSNCKSLSSITFESNSHLTRIESAAFSYSSLQSILIPRNVEILESDCFSYCKSRSSISFESNSHLTRIESGAFSSSSLESILVPRSVQFIDGSAFKQTELSSISIENGNEIFSIEHDFLIDILHHKLIHNFSNSSHLTICSDIEILGSTSFSKNESLSLISFESPSRLIRIESNAFSYSSIESIIIPRSVQFIDSSAFTPTKLSSISIENGNEIFSIERGFLIDILHHKSIYNFSNSSHLTICSDIEILGSTCFSENESLSLI
jgi:hypothetical protein